MRFRPLLPAAGWLVAVAAVRAVRASTTTRPASDCCPRRLHRGIHIAFVLGLIFLVFSWNQQGQRQRAPSASLLAPGGIRCIDWLCAIAAVDHRASTCPTSSTTSQFRVGNPDHDRLDHGHGHDRGAARGDAAQRRLAAADHRRRAHGLRAVRPLAAGHPRASRRHLEKRRQPSLSHQPGHLRHRARRRRDLRLPLRAVRRARDAHRPRPALHRPRDRAGRPLLPAARPRSRSSARRCSA